MPPSERYYYFLLTDFQIFTSLSTALSPRLRATSRGLAKAGRTTELPLKPKHFTPRLRQTACCMLTSLFFNDTYFLYFTNIMTGFGSSPNSAVISFNLPFNSPFSCASISSCASIFCQNAISLLELLALKFNVFRVV